MTICCKTVHPEKVPRVMCKGMNYVFVFFTFWAFPPGVCPGDRGDLAGWDASLRPDSARPVDAPVADAALVRQLITFAVSRGPGALMEMLGQPERATEVAAAQRFFLSPQILAPSFWKEANRRQIPQPPRVLLESWARALAPVDDRGHVRRFLHPSALRWAYATDAEIHEAAKLFVAYFDTPRRQSRPLVGGRVLHEADAGGRARIVHNVGLLHTSEDMEKHMRNLSSPGNLRYYWNYREAQLEHRAAGLDLASGSTALEPMWLESRQMGFDHANRIRKRRAEMLLNLRFLRITFRRAQAKNLPTIARNSPAVANYLATLAQFVSPGGTTSPEWCELARAKWSAHLQFGR